MSARSFQVLAVSTSPSMLTSALSLLGYVSRLAGPQPFFPDTGQEFQSSPTQERLTMASRPSISSTEGIPVSPSPTLESDREPTIRVTCGPASSAPFAYYDRDTSSLKTSQGTFDMGSNEPSLILPNSGLMHAGLLYEQAMSAHPTNAPESSLLPTPAANEPGGTAENHLIRKNEVDGRNRVTPTHLAYIKKLLPTPTSADGENAGSRDALNSNAKPGTSLTDVFRLLPNPAARDGEFTNLQSDAGNESRAPQHQNQRTLWGD